METVKVTKIIGVYDSTFAGKKKVVFRTSEHGEKQISALTQYPDSIKEGGELFGEIKEKESNGKTYYNFYFGKKDENKVPESRAAATDVKLYMEHKLLPVLESLQTQLKLLDRKVGAIYAEVKKPVQEEDITPNFGEEETKIESPFGNDW